jgi:medium-chain acyl-[acyl-carrier-protein] hydrolase
VSAWFARYERVARPGLRLVCFPHAGAGAAVYRPWIPLLPADVELWAVELPGRATRIAEPARADLPALADELASAVTGEVPGPFAFFGHSMGALLAFEVGRRLARDGGAQPRHLVVAGARAPQLLRNRPLIASLPDAELVRVIVERYGGIPEPLLRQPELMSLFLPTLRADLRALEDYAYAYAAAPPLTVPIAALAGADDDNAPAADMACWEEQTSGGFALHTFEGGHFFVHAHRGAVVRLLSRDVFPPRSDAPG